MGKYTCWCLDLQSHEWADLTHPSITGQRNPSGRRGKLQRMLTRKVMCKRLVSSDVKVDAVLDDAIDRDPYVTFDTVTNVVPLDNRTTPEFLLAILNSTLMSVYLRDIVFCRSKLTMDLDEAYLGQLPVKLPGESDRLELEDLARRIGVLTQDMENQGEDGAGETSTTAERQALVTTLDERIFGLYGVHEHMDLFRRLRQE